MCSKATNQNFRAKVSEDTWRWWCKDCYNFIFAECDTLGWPPHEIEFPILCAHCDAAPAAFKSQSATAKIYWCYACYEKVEHTDLPHDMYDLDSASSSGGHSDGEQDLSPKHDPHQSSSPSSIVGDDAQSLSSWCKAEDALSLSSWQHMEDDAQSTSSFR